MHRCLATRACLTKDRRGFGWDGDVHDRHDLADEQWALLEPLFPAGAEKVRPTVCLLGGSSNPWASTTYIAARAGFITNTRWTDVTPRKRPSALGARKLDRSPESAQLYSLPQRIPRAGLSGLCAIED